MARLLLALFLCAGHMLLVSAYECDTGELRLVNGSSSNSGRVEFCRSGVWGTVSDIEFDINDAKVACRKLGYNPDANGLSYVGGAAYGQGTGQVNIGYLYCEGTEESLLDCQHDNTWIGTDHTHDVGITCPLSSCTQGSLRLTGGFLQTEGTLEVCNSGSWNIICADQFQRQDGFVACRQLGYPATATQVITDYRFSNGHGSPTWTQFLCVGNESALTDCPYSTGVCQAYNPNSANLAIVGLKCEGQVIPPNNCTENSIRLNGPSGVNTEEGRIELCSNGVWGTVSSTNFGYKDGRAACRQLLYGAPGVRVYPPSYFGDGSGPILMNDLACLGSEYNLYQCNRQFNSYAQSHSNDATVKCWRKVGVTCTDYDVRFQNGSSDYGRLEVCLFQEWGSICDDGWDRNDARTICRQQNFDPSYASFYINSAYGDGDTIPVKFTNINCAGSESTISSCGRNDQIETNCNFGHTVGVRCFNPDGCTNGDVRLIGGQSDREGDVQVCRDGKWGYVCSDTWNDVNAKTVCKQLQLSDTWSAYSTTGLFDGSQDQAPLVYDGMTCTGSETSLTSCTVADYGTLNPTCTAIAGAMCAESGTTCTEWDVRLMGGSSSDGRVEVCRTNTWTTVDSMGWDYNDAQVVCRQRGFYDAWAVALTSSQFGSGYRRIAHNNFQCSGSETELQTCTNSVYAANTIMESWYANNRAGVSCRMQNEAETCSVEGSVRLQDGASSREGRVEVCQGGYWGSVCSTGWSRLNSLVACRSAGFETLRPMTTQSAYSGSGQGPVNLAYVSCLGNEASLSDCAYASGIGVTNCYHGNDVGVKCPEIPASYYNLSVTSSPSPYDIPIGTQVQLSCVSDPAPPSGVTYEWKTTIAEDPLSQSSPSSPSATLTITHRHPKISNYYCAMKWDDEVLAIGSITLSVQNTLVPAQSTYTGGVGGSVTLSVTQTPSMGLSYLRNLQWYFDGKPVQSVLSDYSLSSDGLSLTLNDLTELHSGYYSVRYDGLNLYQYSLLCEQETMNFLREYPLLSPAVLKLVVGNVNIPDRSQGLPDSVLYPGVDFTQYKDGTPYLSLVTHTFLPSSSSFTSLQWHEFSFASFSSGNASELYSATGLLSPLSDPHYELQFLQPTLLQNGYYETQLTTEPRIVLNFIGCSAANGYSYADFINTQLGFTSPIVIGSAKQAIGYYETPTATVNTTTSAFTDDSNATLTCSASGGYPLYYNVSIVKNGVTVANTIGSPDLVFNTEEGTTGRKYGSYWCVVNNLYDNGYASILLRETASLTLSLEVNNCNMWNNDTRDVFQGPIFSLLQDICNCTLSSGVLTVSDLVCSTDAEEMTSEVGVTSSLSYSSSDGNQTSSTVFQSLFDSLNSGNILSVSVSNQSLRIIWPLNTSDEPFTLPEEALLTILFISGFIAAALIFTIVIVIVCFVQRKRRKVAAQRSAPPVAFHTRQNEARIEEEERPLPAADSSVNRDDADDDDDDEEENWEFPNEKNP